MKPKLRLLAAFLFAQLAYSIAEYDTTAAE
jgi:hypothetical protein